MVKRRFVFVLSKPGDEVVDGSDHEVRGDSFEDALREIHKLVMRLGANRYRLIGERVGIKSSARFFPLCPMFQVPDHIRQNENVIDVKRVA